MSLAGVAARAARDVVQHLDILVHGVSSEPTGPTGVFHAIPWRRLVEIRLHVRRGMDLAVEEALAALLAKDPEQPRDEPQIAAAIGAQLEHMELGSMPIGLRRRVRDIVGRVKPQRSCEIGAGIGHMSAWLLDLWDRSESPAHHDLIEAGGKFGVILTRLIRRYDAEDRVHVKVGDFEAICAANDSWKAAHATMDEAAISESPPLYSPYDLIIVDVGSVGQVDAIRLALSQLSPGGLLLTPEPEVPTTDVGAISDDGPSTPEQARVVAFNDWVAFITKTGQTQPVGFVPLHGGTLVGIVQP